LTWILHDLSEQAFRRTVWSGGTFSIAVTKIIEFDDDDASQNLVMAITVSMADDERLGSRQSRCRQA
jgi:hypothetical protein